MVKIASAKIRNGQRRKPAWSEGIRPVAIAPNKEERTDGTGGPSFSLFLVSPLFVSRAHTGNDSAASHNDRGCVLLYRWGPGGTVPFALSLALACTLSRRLSPSLSLSLPSSLGNISRNPRSERAGQPAGFLRLFCPAPFSKSALKEKRTGTVFRYTVTIDQRDRTTAPAVRASRVEAKRDEARRGETRDVSGGTGNRNGTGRIWAVTGRTGTEGKRERERDKGAR